MKLELEINKDNLLNELCNNLNEQEFNNLILELIRIKYHSYNSNYGYLHLEYLVNCIKNYYIILIN